MVKRAFVLGVTALLFSGSVLGQPAQLKFASVAPPKSFFITDTVEPWVKWVQDQVGNETEIKVFAGGTLGRDPAQELNLVRDRVADFTLTLPAYTPGRFPDLTVLELPGLVRNETEGSKAVWAMYKRGLIRGFEEFKVVGFYSTDTYSLHSATEIKSFKDVRDLKLRSAGPVQNEIARAFGAVPVGMPVTQIAENISRKIVSGAILNWTALIPFKVNQVTRYHYNAELGVLPLVIVMNKEAYAGLSARSKAVIDASGERIVELGGGAFAKFRKIFLEQHRAEPQRTIIEPSAQDNREMAALFKNVHDDWKAKNGVAQYNALVEILAEIRAGR